MARMRFYKCWCHFFGIWILMLVIWKQRMVTAMRIKKLVMWAFHRRMCGWIINDGAHVCENICYRSSLNVYPHRFGWHLKAENIICLEFGEKCFCNDNERKVEGEGGSIRLRSSIREKPQPTAGQQPVGYGWLFMVILYLYLYLYLRLYLFLYLLSCK